MTTKTAASTYQQLRNHLVDLKLADAADALPAVLDQAAAEGWSLTQALEQLLRIEVTATDARRLAGRFRFANLPTGATLVACQRDGTTVLPRGWDHLEVLSSMADLVSGVNGDAPALPVGGAFDDEGVRA